ncbi:MAG: lysozyme inhibitor LprI family protein [Pseudomonadota bacterium]
MRYLFLLTLFLIIPNAYASETGASEDPCQNIDTEFGMYDCISAQYKDAEKHLMSVYNQALFRLQKDTKGLRQSEIEDIEKRIEIFEKSQESWIKYRETTCMAETYNETEETRQFMKMRLCYLRLAERRTDDIEGHYELWFEKDYKNRARRAVKRKTESEGSSITKQQ